MAERPPPIPPPGLTWNTFRTWRKNNNIKGTTQEIKRAWDEYSSARISPKRSPSKKSPAKSPKKSPSKEPPKLTQELPKNCLEPFSAEQTQQLIEKLQRPFAISAPDAQVEDGYGNPTYSVFTNLEVWTITTKHPSNSQEWTLVSIKQTYAGNEVISSAKNQILYTRDMIMTYRVNGRVDVLMRIDPMNYKRLLDERKECVSIKGDYSTQYAIEPFLEEATEKISQCFVRGNKMKTNIHNFLVTGKEEYKLKTLAKILEDNNSKDWRDTKDPGYNHVRVAQDKLCDLIAYSGFVLADAKYARENADLINVHHAPTKASLLISRIDQVLESIMLRFHKLYVSLGGSGTIQNIKAVDCMSLPTKEEILDVITPEYLSINYLKILVTSPIKGQKVSSQEVLVFIIKDTEIRFYPDGSIVSYGTTPDIDSILDMEEKTRATSLERFGNGYMPFHPILLKNVLLARNCPEEEVISHVKSIFLSFVATYLFPCIKPLLKPIQVKKWKTNPSETAKELLEKGIAKFLEVKKVQYNRMSKPDTTSLMTNIRKLAVITSWLKVDRSILSYSDSVIARLTYPLYVILMDILEKCIKKLTKVYLQL